MTCPKLGMFDVRLVYQIKSHSQIGVRGQKSLGNGAADRGALARTFK